MPFGSKLYIKSSYPLFHPSVTLSLSKEQVPLVPKLGNEGKDRRPRDRSLRGSPFESSRYFRPAASATTWPVSPLWLPPWASRPFPSWRLFGFVRRLFRGCFFALFRRGRHGRRFDLDDVIDPFQEGHGRGIRLTRPELHDAGVAAIAVLEAGRDLS